MKQHTPAIIIIGLVATFAGAFWYANQANQVANEDVVIEPNVKGNPEATIELIKYSDFQCPACAGASTIIDQLLAKHGDQIRFEYRHFPLVTIHQLAIPAARAAEAAGQQGQFFAMHDKLFSNQQTWSKAPNPTASFVTYAEELGLDVATFRRHLNSSLIEEHVQAQFNEARELGLTGTPSFLLNGEKIKYQSFVDFVTQIEAAVAGGSATTFPQAPTNATISPDASETIVPTL